MRALKITGYLLVLLFAAYSAIWYFQGKANLRQVDAWMDNLSDAPFVKAMSYDALTLKGYPFKIIIEMKKPKITVDTKLIADTFLAQALPADKKMQNGTFETYTDGSIQLQTNITGNHYTLKTLGDFHSTHESDKHSFHYRQSTDENWIKLKFNTWDALLGFSNLESLSEKDFESFDAFLNGFEKIEFYAKNARIVNDMNDELLYSVNEISYGANYDELSQELIKAGFYIDIKNIEVTEAYAREIENLMKSFDLPYTPINTKAYNHTSGHFFASYNGPKFEENMNKPQGPIHAKIDFAFENDLYQYDNKGHILVAFEEGEFVDLDVDFEGDALFKPESHPYLIETHQALMSEIENAIPEGQSPPQASQMFEFMNNHLEEMVPKFYELGKMHGDLKLYAKQLGASMFSVDLKDLSFINELYGLALNGQMKFSMLMPIPTGQMQFKMSQFDVFFDRIGKYADLLIAYHNENQLQKPPHLNAQLIPKMKTFLRKLAQETAADSKDVTLQFDFQMQDPFVKVGGKSQNEVTNLFMELFPPQAPEPEPTIQPGSTEGNGFE